MRISAADEGLHAAGPELGWAESWTFDFFAGNGALAGWVRLTRLPAHGRSWYHAFLAGSGRQLVAVAELDAPEVDRTLEFRTTGLWAAHVCETPLDHWTVGLEAFGLGIDDPAELYGRQRGDRVPLGFDLEWEALEPPDEAATGAARYTQGCRVTGEVLVAYEVIDLDGHGMRSRQWGEWGGWSTRWFDAHARLVDGTVVRTNIEHAASPAATAGIPVETEVVAEGTTLRWVPVVVTPVELTDPEGRRTRIPRALCRVHLADGRAGWGWAEWNEPQAGVSAG